MKILKIAALLLAAAAPVAFGCTADVGEAQDEAADALTVADEASAPEDVADEEATAESEDALAASFGCPFNPSICQRHCFRMIRHSIGVCVGRGRSVCNCRPRRPF